MLNKNDGKVVRIVNHTLLPQPLIDLNVAIQLGTRTSGDCNLKGCE